MACHSHFDGRVAVHIFSFFIDKSKFLHPMQSSNRLMRILNTHTYHTIDTPQIIVTFSTYV